MFRTVFFCARSETWYANQRLFNFYTIKVVFSINQGALALLSSLTYSKYGTSPAEANPSVTRTEMLKLVFHLQAKYKSYKSLKNELYIEMIKDDVSA